jgi:hypothetical protein
MSVKMKNFDLILGCLCIFVVFVAVVGFPNTTVKLPTIEKDIVLNGTPTLYQNGPDEWFVNGSVYSRRHIHYSQATLLITAYDAESNVIGQKNTTVYNLNPNANFQTVLMARGTIAFVTVRARNASRV